MPPVVLKQAPAPKPMSNRSIPFWRSSTAMPGLPSGPCFTTVMSSCEMPIGQPLWASFAVGSRKERGRFGN